MIMIKIRQVDERPLSNNERRHLDRAIIAAGLGSMRNRHAAVITRGGTPIAVGINRQRNQISEPPIVQHQEISYHAEVAAMRALGIYTEWNKCTMYVVRINKLGEPMQSKPCQYCLEHINLFGLKEIIHT